MIFEINVYGRTFFFFMTLVFFIFIIFIDFSAFADSVLLFGCEREIRNNML